MIKIESEFADIPKDFKIYDYMKPLLEFDPRAFIISCGVRRKTNFSYYYLLEKELNRIDD